MDDRNTTHELAKMSSSQVKSDAVKGAPKISAKEKFAAAQAAKQAEKAAKEVEKAKKEAVEAAMKAKHDAAFEKEKGKVAKEQAAEAALVKEFTTRISKMASQDKENLMSELKTELANFHRNMRLMHREINCHAELVGKEAARYSAVNIMIGILERNM